jgi:hypothetical protein
MRSNLRLLIGLGGVLAAAPAAAQSAGTVELGAFGRWTGFGEPLATDLTHKLPAENGLGVGGRLGIFFVRHLEAEADVSYTTVDVATRVTRRTLTYFGLFNISEIGNNRTIGSNGRRSCTGWLRSRESRHDD